VLLLFIQFHNVSDHAKEVESVGCNVWGLNSEDRQREVRAKIDESECDVICLQETKCETFNWRSIRKFCPKRFDSFVFSPSVGASGALLSYGTP
jgi:exonuclease III